MVCKNLINLMDEFNDHNVIACLNLKPDNIIFIHEDNKEDHEEFNIIRDYLIDKLPRTDIVGVPVKDSNPIHITEIISRYNDRDTVINLSGGNKLMSLLAYKISQKNNMKAIFVDMEEEVVIDLSDGTTEEINMEFIELEVNDFVGGAGGEILAESSYLFDNKQVTKLIDYIIDNYEVWGQIKNMLKNLSIIQHDKLFADTVIVNLSNMDETYKEQYKNFINILIKLKLVVIKYSSRKKIVLQFKNMDYKGLIFKLGTWLEVLVYRLVKEIEEVDDVKSGVIFLWDDEVRHVKNEIDVVASANSKLIYISCKDSENYDVDTLNEIEVYSQQLGGRRAKKVLVATKESFKRSTTLRAEEMDIDIIIFEGSIEKLKMELTKVIMD